MKVWEKFEPKQMNVQDLVEQIKSTPPKIGSKEEIKAKKEQLQKLINITVKDTKQKMKDIQDKIFKEKNYFERFRMSILHENLAKKLKQPAGDLDIGFLRNEIRRLEGKDFYYLVNTGFAHHKIMHSEIVKEKNNSIFLNLMKADVLKEIKKLESSKDIAKDKKIRILKDKLLPVIEFNIKVDKVRNIDIEKIDKKLRSKIDKASNPNIGKDMKGGEYPIEIILSEELIELL